MAKSHDDFKDETDRKVREWHEKRAEEERRPVGIMGVAGTPLPGGQPLSGSAAPSGAYGLGICGSPPLTRWNTLAMGQ